MPISHRDSKRRLDGMASMAEVDARKASYREGAMGRLELMERGGGCTESVRISLY